jgi:hypothetical protein
MLLSSQKEVFTVYILILLIATAIISLPILISFSIKLAYGDGLTQEQISASLGNRKANLLIKMIPPIVTTETLQNGQKPIIEFRLFNSNTNQSFSHVTYYIIIEKDGKRLLSDIFHDHNGDLRIEVNPSNTSKISIIGQQDPLLGTWIRNAANPVTASGPIFMTGGLYHFIVRISTIDSDITLLPDNQEPIYDSWLSVDNTENKQISIGDEQIPIKIISYYDRLTDVGFDNKNMQMKFNMSFNWNLSRLSKASIFVHEEVSIPKPNAFTTKGSYTGTVNGIDISKDIMLDNTNPDKDVIYVMIPKNTIIQLADKVNKSGQVSTGLMEFTLQAGRTGAAISSEK